MKNQPKRERTVSFYDIKAKTSCWLPEIVPSRTPIEQALETALNTHATLRHPMNRRGPYGRMLNIQDWVFDRQRREHYLVVNCADPSLADPAFKHLQTGRARMAGKLNEEAIDASTHALIKLPAADQPLATARMLVTSGSGVSAAQISTFFSVYLRMASKAANNPHAGLFLRNHPDNAQGNTYRVRISIDVAAHQSETLQRILQAGLIEEIELIAPQEAEWETDLGFEAFQIATTIRPGPQVGRLSIARIRRWFQDPRYEDVAQARVHYREAPDGAVQTHRFNTSRLEEAFTKNEKITFDTDISSWYQRVNMTVVDRMRALL